MGYPHFYSTVYWTKWLENGKNVEKHGIDIQVELDYNLKEVCLNCLAFVNDLIILAKNTESATTQINLL